MIAHFLTSEEVSDVSWHPVHKCQLHHFIIMILKQARGHHKDAVSNHVGYFWPVTFLGGSFATIVVSCCQLLEAPLGQNVVT